MYNFYIGVQTFLLIDNKFVYNFLNNNFQNKPILIYNFSFDHKLQTKSIGLWCHVLFSTTCINNVVETNYFWHNILLVIEKIFNTQVTFLFHFRFMSFRCYVRKIEWSKRKISNQIYFDNIHIFHLIYHLILTFFSFSILHFESCQIVKPV